MSRVHNKLVTLFFGTKICQKLTVFIECIMAEAYKNMAHQKNSGYFYKALVIKKLHPQNIKTTQEWNKVSSIGTLR